jgi:hypothetical protein
VGLLAGPAVPRSTSTLAAAVSPDLVGAVMGDSSAGDGSGALAKPGARSGVDVYVRYRRKSKSDRPTSIIRMRVNQLGHVVSRQRLAGRKASWPIGAHNGRVIVAWRPDGSQRLMTSSGRMIGTLPVDCQSIPYDYGDGWEGPPQPVVCFPLAGRPVVVRLLTWFGVVQRVNLRTGHVHRVRDIGRNFDKSTLMDRSGHYLYVNTANDDATTIREVDLRTGDVRVLTRVHSNREVIPVCLTDDRELLAVKGAGHPSEVVLLTAERVVRIDLKTGDKVAAYPVKRTDLPVQSAMSGFVGCTANGRWLVATVGHPAHLAALRPATTKGHRIGPDRPIRHWAVITDNT